MYTNDLMHTISALTECAHKMQKKPGQKAHNVIALSVGAGTGGREIARILAERLEMPLYDKDIVELLAQESHLDKAAVERIDERLDGFKGAWLYSILSGMNISKESYRKNLFNVVQNMACRGGVILGRGGSFILADLPVLRVHIVGTLDVCIERLAGEEGISHKEASRQIQETDEARHDYLRKIFKCDNGADPAHFDLVVNSDHMAPENVAQLILDARKYIKLEPESS